QINARHLETTSSGFRTSDVYCIDRYGREIHFSPPREIDDDLSRLLAVFSGEFQSADDISLLSRAFARFYYGFIAVHPFSNGNHRTVCTFLQRRAQEKSYDLESLKLLRKILLEGSVAAEMQKLITAFKLILKPI
ncbi:MAG TPA: Fic family protein, partial [Alphaproteobacteria bacterium]|nr:Fic family protein [Alphaproteobacteria bacterium]